MKIDDKIKACNNCGKLFVKPKKFRSSKSWNKAKYCSKQCYWESLKGKTFHDRTGELSHNKGKKGWTNAGSFKKGHSDLVPKESREKSRKKISKALIGRKCPWANPPHYRGKEHPNWQGGISFEPYSVDWTETLRRSIRERDNNICQLCNQYGNIVHHIDYDKKNCNPVNLITLCLKCHLKTNYNRKYWTKRLKIIMKNRYEN